MDRWKAAPESFLRHVIFEKTGFKTGIIRVITNLADLSHFHRINQIFSL